MEVEIDRAIFNDVYVPYLSDMSRTQIFYGGSSSGKSVFIAQRCVMDVMRGNRNYLVARQVGRTLRGSVFTEITRVINEWGVNELFNINKSDMLITCHNGYQIIFVGLDDTEKLKSIVPATGVLTDIWVEEATETNKDAIKQLYKRQRGGKQAFPKRLTMSFNPILKNHWICTEHFAPIGWSDEQENYESKELTILKTWYIHNKFLTPDDIKDLTNETDEYYYGVYTLGNWGVLGNRVFTNWRVEDLSGMRDQFIYPRVGLDFGFSADPAAMPVTHYDRMRKTIYIYDELYEAGLTNDLLASEIKTLVGNNYVVCDSAEPKSIAELRRYDVNAAGAKKGKDSVLFGIQWLQQQTIVVDKSCINMQNELALYKWREDKAGNAIRQPVDKNNHLIDALRYAYEDEGLDTWTVQ